MKIYPGMLCKIVGAFENDIHIMMLDCEDYTDAFLVKKNSLALILTQHGDGMLVLLTSTKQIGTIHSCVCDIIG
jgi:hypothetical protein